VLGFAMMVGALIFLGCPLRMMLRIAAGDLNAVVGFVGFVVGIFIGVFFLNRGYSLGRTQDVAKTDGLLMPVISLILLVVLLVAPSVLRLSEAGPGSMRAPIIVALGMGLLMGGIGFVSRMCFVGGIRDAVLFKSFGMLGAFIALIVTVFVGNLIFGSFNLGFYGQPVAHSMWVWNVAGMMLVGLCAVLAGGCPLRQVVLAGSGNSDSAITVIGMIAGAAFAHNFDMAASPMGVSNNGKIGFIVFSIIVVFIAVFNTFGKKVAMHRE